MNVAEYREPVDGDFVEINKLLRELSTDAPMLTLARLQKICVAPNVHLFVVRDEERGGGLIVGMATLEIAETLMGIYGYVHDVVVSSAYRGKGLGKMLMGKLIAAAKELGVRHIDLTSNPKRDAGAFYLSLGFIKRDTDCYRRELS